MRHEETVRVLLVDDNPDDRMLVIRALREEFPRLEVDQIYDRASFEDVLDRADFDVVITDYQIRWGTGLEVLERIKARLPDCPVIMFTGTGSEEIAVEALKKGLDDYILKSPKHLKRLPPAVRVALARREERLRAKEMEERFRELFETLPVGVYRTTPDGRILEVNRAWLEMYRCPDKKALTDTKIQDLYENPSDRDVLLRRLKEEGFVRGFEARLRRFDGSLMWVRLYARARREDSGGIRYIDGAVEDISEQKRTEEALRESERRYRLLAENVSDVIWTMDRDLRYTYISPSMVRLRGFTPEETMTQSLEDVLTPESLKAIRKALEEEAELERSGDADPHRSRTLELELKCKDGSTVWTEIRMTAIRDESGRPVEFLGVTRDITERKRTEEELRRRTRHLEALNAVIAAAIRARNVQELLDTALGPTLQAFGVLTGWIRIGEHVAFKGGTSETVWKLVPRIRELGLDRVDYSRVEDFETLNEKSPLFGLRELARDCGVRAALGVSIWLGKKPLGGILLLSSEPRPWSDEEVALAMAVGSQLASAVERLELLEELRAQTQRLEGILEAVPDGVALLSGDRRVLLMNAKARDYLRALLPDEAFLEEDTPAVRFLGEEPLEHFLEPPEEGKSFHEVEVAGPPRRVFEVAIRRMDSREEGEGYVAVLRDVTRTRDVQEKMEVQERLAAVGQLAAGIAHDFNNLLTSVMGYAQMHMETSRVPDSVRQDLGVIAEQARRAAHLIRQILDFSRRSVVDKGPLELHSFLKEMVKVLRRTIPENIKIFLEAEAGDFLVEGDLSQLQQVITNVVVNARDAMPQGGECRIRLCKKRFRPHERPPLPEMPLGKEWVVVSISDQGVGIPREHLEHIFEPFFTTKEIGVGTGLGLAQVYGIVKQHEGFIDVESQVGRGSTFYIYLPALETEEEEGEEEPERPLMPRGRGEEILLVEDEDSVRKVVSMMLDRLGYRVTEAKDGREALLRFREVRGSFSLVITDVVMPDMGGVALLKALRDVDPQVQVLLMSGYPLGEDLQHFVRGGQIVGWLSKPISLEDLATKVREAIEGT